MTGSSLVTLSVVVTGPHVSAAVYAMVTLNVDGSTSVTIFRKEYAASHFRRQVRNRRREGEINKEKTMAKADRDAIRKDLDSSAQDATCTSR